MSWVVSLGAGREQIPLIRAIQAEGHKCLAFDKDPKAPGKDVADYFDATSNRDPDAILRVLGSFGFFVDGVMAAGSEVPDVMSILSHRLGLPGVPVATGMLLKDKLLYKKVLKAAGVPHTEAHVTYVGSIKVVFDELKYEVVVKPQRGSGSRGVSIVRHRPMELDIAYHAAEAVCPDVIVERYESGPQISSETLIWDDMAVTAAFVDRFYDKDSLKELGGSSPSENIDYEPESTHIIHRAAFALGMRRGTIKADLVITESGPKIIEMTCRISGGPLASIVKRSTGVDYMRQAVRIACGIEPDWNALKPTIKVPVAVDMNGYQLGWAETRKYARAES